MRAVITEVRMWQWLLHLPTQPAAAAAAAAAASQATAEVIMSWAPRCGAAIKQTVRLTLVIDSHSVI
jgi:hypothetical protein